MENRYSQEPFRYYSLFLIHEEVKKTSNSQKSFSVRDRLYFEFLPLLWSSFFALLWLLCKETAEEKYGAVTFKAFYDFNNQKLQVEGRL